MYEIWSEKERLESKIIPRFRAEETGCIVVFEEIVSVGLWILESFAGSPMRRNSVSAGLRDKKFEAIHEEMLVLVFCKSRIFSEKVSAENDRKRLSVVSIEFMIDRWLRYYWTEWSCIEYEE